VKKSTGKGNRIAVSCFYVCKMNSIRHIVIYAAEEDRCSQHATRILVRPLTKELRPLFSFRTNRAMPDNTNTF